MGSEEGEVEVERKEEEVVGEGRGVVEHEKEEEVVALDSDDLYS